VAEAIRGVVRGGSGGLTIGDPGAGIGGIGEGINLPPSPGRQGSNLELLSDPMGVDFRPYLIQILSAVRRNWWAVMPEAARLGRRGRVGIQFSIARNGSVPKLVIATSSGTDALDRAAVAGISASNPFPPLPTEYKGDQIRLQFNFAYNMPSR
jgi:TonB family protein